MTRNAFAFLEPTEVRTVPLDSIVVQSQVRRHFDEDKLRSLTDSIRRQGVLQPLGVKDSGDGSYLLIMGERRYRASREAGLTEVPVRLLTNEEAENRTVQVIENLQREDLNSIERTEALLELFADRWGMSIDEARKHMRRVRKNAEKSPEEAEKIRLFFREFGVHWASFVAAELSNLTMPEGLKALCREEGLDITKAREIAKITDEKLRLTMARRTIDEDWPLRRVKEEVAPHLPVRRGRPTRLTTPRELRDSWVPEIEKLPEARRKAAMKVLAQLVDIIYPGQSDGSAARGRLPTEAAGGAHDPLAGDDGLDIDFD